MKKLLFLLLFCASQAYAGELGLYRIPDITVYSLSNLKTFRDNIAEKTKRRRQPADRVSFYVSVSTKTTGDPSVGYLTNDYRNDKLKVDSETREVLLICSSDIEKLASVQNSLDTGKGEVLEYIHYTKHGYDRQRISELNPPMTEAESVRFFINDFIERHTYSVGVSTP